MTRVDVAVAAALAKRDLRRYFTSPIGYVFVTLFIFLGAAAAFWRPRFFSNNLANLDQLNEVVPYLLLFFVPALSMGIWSEERKQGTDELLLTLPATERDLVIGKFAALLGIYSVSVLLSLSHALVLIWLGRPDPGLLVGNYLGYWLLGAFLIPIAMFASLFTANAAVAFILGSLLCAVPIGLGPATSAIDGSLGRRLAFLGAVTHFQDFTRGIVSLGGLAYFLLLTGFFLHVVVVALARRRRPRQWRSALHHAANLAAVAVILGCLIVLTTRTRMRLDLTAGRMHSLSAETRQLVRGLPPNRPVVIQAFVSPNVPEPFVQTREDLLAVLHEIEAVGGNHVTLTVHETEPYSEQARFARERYDIVPHVVADPYSGEAAQDVYLGVALTAGGDEQVIGFFERGLSAEYEIARAVRVVSRAHRKRVGIIDSDVQIFGGVDFRDREARPQWAIVDELRQQYDVVEITPMSAIRETVDALLVVLPSRLSQSEIDLVQEPIRRGTPTMILLDPLPALDIRLAPAAQLASELDPYRTDQPTVQRNFGDVRKMLIDLGVNWVPARIAFDGYSPHPDLSQMPQEAVFVGKGSGNPDAFDRHDVVTANLQEVLFLYPGALAAADPARFTFEPLLSTGPLSGIASFFDVVRPSRSGLVLNASFPHQPGKNPNVLAARLRSKAAVAPDPGAKPIDVIVVADLDFISDNFFDIRASAAVNASFDNIAFFLNAIDSLVGDDSFISLRNHRVRHRTLERVEARTRTFMARRRQEEQQADSDARSALTEAQGRLKARLEEIDQRRDLDAQAKQMMTRNLQETEERRLRVLEANIELNKNKRILASREAMEGQVRQIRNTIRAVAILLPPVPVLVIGVIIFIGRRRREQAGARAAGRLRTASSPSGL